MQSLLIVASVNNQTSNFYNSKTFTTENSEHKQQWYNSHNIYNRKPL